MYSHLNTLVLDMDQSGWASMTVAEATVLYWLKDLDASKKHQAELGDLIHRAWDRADAQCPGLHEDWEEALGERQAK